MMPAYKFAVGEQVQFVPAPTDFHVPRGTYVIVRRFPFQGKDCSYRVKHTRDGHERVIPESQLDRM
jgi:hypothetical protein